MLWKGLDKAKLENNWVFSPKAPSSPLRNPSTKATAPWAKQSVYLRFSFHLTNKIHTRGSLNSHLELRLNMSLNVPFLCEFSFQMQYQCVLFKSFFPIEHIRNIRSKLERSTVIICCFSLHKTQTLPWSRRHSGTNTITLAPLDLKSRTECLKDW